MTCLDCGCPVEDHNNAECGLGCTACGDCESFYLPLGPCPIEGSTEPGHGHTHKELIAHQGGRDAQ